MSRVVPIIFDADFNRLRREWDETRAYIQRTVPRIDLTGAGTGTRPVRTFGGESVEVSTAPAAGPGMIPAPAPRAASAAASARAAERAEYALENREASDRAREQRAAASRARAEERAEERAAASAASRAAREGATGARAGERAETRLENREASERAREAREAAAIARIRSGTAITEAGTRGGTRGALAEIDRQIGGGGSDRDIARLQARRAAALERIIREEEAEAARLASASARTATAETRRARADEARAARGEIAADRRDDRYERRIRRAQMMVELERDDDPARRAAIARRYAEEETDPIQRRRFEARALREQRRYSFREFLTDRFEGMGGFIFAGAAVSHLGSSIETELRASEGRRFLSLDQQLSTDISGIEQRNPLVGLGRRVLAGAANMATALTGNPALGAFGPKVADYFDDAKALEQLREAQQSQRAVRVTEAARRDTIDANAQARISGLSGTSGTLAGITDEQRKIQREAVDARREVSGLWGIEARRAQNTISAAEQAKLNETRVRFGRVLREHMELVGMEISRAEFGTTATTAIIAGDQTAARRAAVDALFTPMKDPQGNVISFHGIDITQPGGKDLTDARRKQYNAALKQADQESRREELKQIGESRTMQVALNDKPLAARLSEIETERTVASEGVSDKEKRRVANLAGLKIMDAEKSDRRQASLIAFNQAAEERSLRARLGRDEVGAAAIDFTTAGLNEAVKMERSGYTDRAQKQIKNTALGIDLMRQNYLDNFRAVQTDLRNVDTQGQKDVTDPAAVLGKLDEIKTALESGKAFREALNEAVSK